MRRVHAPLVARLRLVVPAVAVTAALALSAAMLPSPLVWAAAAVAALGAVLVVRAARAAVVIDEERLVIRNPIRTHRIAAGDVDRIERSDRRRSPVRVVTTDRTVTVVSTLGAGEGELAPLFLALRRWSATNRVLDELDRIEFRNPRTRRQLIGSGEEVGVPGRLRRTSSRGWGPWHEGWLRLLPGEEPSHASWSPDDPTSVDLVADRGDRPVPLADPTRVELRPVRFREEAFYGLDAEVIVFGTHRRTVEVAVAPEETDAVLSRLRALGGARK